MSLWIDKNALTFGFRLLGSTAISSDIIFAANTEAMASKSEPLWVVII